MRLELTLPPGSPAIHVEPLLPMPDDLRGHVASLLARLAPDQPVTVESERTSATGWTMRILRTATALFACYEMLGHLGVAMVCATGPEALEILDSARPVWAGPELVAVIDLWS